MNGEEEMETSGWGGVRMRREGRARDGEEEAMEWGGAKG